MRTFRLPALAYLAVAFLFVCTVPLAFSGDGSGTVLDPAQGSLRPGVGGVQLTPLVVLMLIPLFGAVYVARTATFVNEDGIRVRAIFGSRFMPWASIRGLSTEKRTVYAVLETGAVRLPCVKFSDLWLVAKASGGRLPEIPSPLVKSAPAQKRPIYIRKSS